MSSCTMALRIARFALKNGYYLRAQRCMSALAQPAPANDSKQYPPKITNIVEEISKLTLIEVADLNELLKKTLNIQEAPMMAAVAARGPDPAAAEDEEPKLAKIQTSFTLKLVKYDESKKIPLIKELKNIMDGMNLVQAKKFVEESPQVVKAEMSKEEAEALKKSIEAVGGVCEIA